VVGIVFIHQAAKLGGVATALSFNTGTPFFSLSVALNVLLTLMIVARLILHNKNMRDAVGSPARVGGLYTAIITMLIESSALYAINSLLFVVPWSIRSPLAALFFPALAETQVRAVFPFP
jgi:tellurite resistance protein TehA-like permease